MRKHAFEWIVCHLPHCGNNVNLLPFFLIFYFLCSRRRVTLSNDARFTNRINRFSFLIILSRRTNLNE